MKPSSRLNAVLGRAGRYLFALSFSFYVLLHLSLPQVGVKLYVPGYLPFPYFWNYFTGLCLLAFMVSSLLGKCDKLAALLVVYLVLVAVLIHPPKAPGDPMEMLNLFRISNMVGGALMCAAAFARDPRLGLRLIKSQSSAYTP